MELNSFESKETQLCEACDCMMGREMLGGFLPEIKENEVAEKLKGIVETKLVGS